MLLLLLAAVSSLSPTRGQGTRPHTHHSETVAVETMQVCLYHYALLGLPQADLKPDPVAYLLITDVCLSCSVVIGGKGTITNQAGAGRASNGGGGGQVHSGVEIVLK